MKKITIILIVLLLSVSCNEEKEYCLQILLENKTEYECNIILFPKPDYIEGSYYRFADFGTGYNPTNFIIYKDNDNTLFITKNIEIEPYNLARQVFDSIHVIIDDNLQDKIVFKVDTVINYSDNLFSPNSQWNYKRIEAIEPDMFNENPVVIDNYTFVLTE